MSRTRMGRGPLLRIYLLVSYLFPLVAARVLRKRLAKGKEHPSRWVEKRGIGLAPCPGGPLIWLNAVGLGEVMSLRGLIPRLARLRPDASFLVTSTTAASAGVFAKNLPPRTLHQFLPIDAPSYRRRFLDHFAPDLCIWAEQDIWPGFVSDLAARDIPQAVVAARMNRKSFQSHKRAKGIYQDLYRAMDLVTAQDLATAKHLIALGADAQVTGSLKPAAPALRHDADQLQTMIQTLKHRMIWATAPSHAEDEQIALAAHRIVLQTEPSALLIIAPRFLDRRDEVAQSYDAPPPRRSKGEVPDDADPIWLFDTFGDLGLVYSLAQAVLIGGTFNAIQGHNPWEAAALDTAIFHGPQTENFTSDFTMLDQANGAVAVTDGPNLAQALINTDLRQLSQNAAACIETASAQTDRLAADLVAFLDT